MRIAAYDPFMTKEQVEGYGDACQGAGPSNFGTRFQILSVGYGYWQIFVDQTDGF